MSDTQAVPSDWLAKVSGRDDGRPMCPACPTGRLHPYKVTIGLSAGVSNWGGADYLVGWVAVCVGATAGEHYVEQDAAACGFSLPMTPHTHDHLGGRS